MWGAPGADKPAADVCVIAERLTSEEAQTLSDLKTLVARLYESLTVNEHQLEQERKLLNRLHSVKEQLGPLERKKSELVSLSQRRTTLLSWLGLGLMGVQFGILARLTWWEYSWDIMEPVTYFITYGTTMAMYAYFVVTRQVGHLCSFAPEMMRIARSGHFK